MEKKPKVYVVQENPNINYMPAEKFGEVVFMTAIEFSPSKNSIRNASIIESIESMMAAFDPDVDYILLSGNPIVMGYVFSLALAKKGEVCCLWWSRDDRDYTPVLFNPKTVKDVGVSPIPVYYK